MPLLEIPISNRIVDVQIIDTTFRIKDGPLSVFMEPVIKGQQKLNVGAFGYLITHRSPSSGTGEESVQRVLFDLGPPKDWKSDLPEPLVKRISTWENDGATITVEKNISEVLDIGGVDLNTIDGLMWSHAHWDHMGRPSLFPPSTNLIVGPSIRSKFAPGYPENPDAPFFSREFSGREVVELSFESSNLTIGGMKAIDFFNDGSFYILDAPGHAVGHINALARTTTSQDGLNDSFIFLGADSYHLGSQLRPNSYTPLPSSVEIPSFLPCPCPGELFERIHPLPVGGNPSLTPFHIIPEKSVAINFKDAREVISKIQVFDADERVLVLNAHEWNYYDVLDVFPESANEWKRKGWKEKARWRFLGSFQGAVDLIFTDRA
ncbi:hypothetical protein TWF192_002457 [Orbilia oligospora]|uniref:Metallo-beta-lactamase domain-containing protein n=2 Tax=Orbilia oligospora TaxID=2813651 RepID=A0A6G1LSJ0_ORBOL|nr:hypothetical protein TWF191_000203 [Orbilia oligospora]KAF3233259.1 hypothetical protein TWF192_002457 [Orbilia oligospora]